jgi:Predicted xylanase/chitin deacetylase
MKQYVRRILGRVLPRRAEGQSEEEYRGMLLTKGIWAMAFALAALAIVKGAMAALPGSITVSSSVNGQEIPIYCVKTDKKQVALTFEAAGGNRDIERILGILEKHDIHAAFFVTGGWVVR